MLRQELITYGSISSGVALALNHNRKSPSSDDSGQRSSKEFKVVLAEDETPILGIFSNILSRSGFRVTGTFENGKDLVDFIKMNTDPELEPDIVVTDLRMPEMDGVEAAKSIRATKPKIKIILASAYEVPPDEIGSFDATLKKPFSKNELIETISRCLDEE